MLIGKLDKEISEMESGFRHDVKAAEDIVRNGTLKEKESYLEVNKDSNIMLVESDKDTLVKLYTEASENSANVDRGAESSWAEKNTDEAFSLAIEEINALQARLEGNFVDDSGNRIRGIKSRKNLQEIKAESEVRGV